MKLDLDLSGVKTLSSKTVVPTGNYPLEIVGCEVKETKSGGGYYLQTDYKVLDGEHKGSVLVDRHNIKNENEDAQRIGLATIKTILTVGGHKNPDSLKKTEDLMGLKFNAYIEEVDDSFQNDKGETIETTNNKFKSYFPLDDEGPKTKSAPKEAKAETKPEPKPESKPTPKAEDKPKPAPEAAKFPWQS